MVECRRAVVALGERVACCVGVAARCVTRGAVQVRRALARAISRGAHWVIAHTPDRVLLAWFRIRPYAARAINGFLIGVVLVLLATAPWTGIDLVRVAYDGLAAAAAVSTVFTVLYVSRSRWRDFAAGRSLLYVSIMLTGTLLLISVARYAGTDYPGRPILLFLFFTGMPIVLLNLTLTLVRIQRAKAAGVIPPGDVPTIPEPGSIPLLAKGLTDASAEH